MFDEWKDYLFLKHSGQFDPSYYLLKYPDVRKLDIDPLLHFVKHGWLEGRDPSDNFNTRYYLENNPDVRKTKQNPLIHYLRYGRAEGRKACPDRFDQKYLLRLRSNYEYKQTVNSTAQRYPRYSDFHTALLTNDISLLQQHVNALETAIELYDPAASIPPQVTIIIPVFDHFEETLNCLKSFIGNRERTTFEIILIDDGSTDETSAVFSCCKRIRYVRNEENLGFLRSCNKAASLAIGEFIVFLNNDTYVMPGWLDAIIATFRDAPDIGLVGSKLVFPDGTLQEAGGVIWEDGTGITFGRGADPNTPEFSYLRETDYCSGASLCIPRSLWTELGGFDELFAPAYYEDTDLAFRVRQHGYAVVCQPFSRVVHIEGATSGTDISSGVKQNQELNRHKFIARWGHVLSSHGKPSQPVENYRNRTRRQRALVIDACTPRPDHDSGSIDTYNYLLSLRKMGFEVQFISVGDSEIYDQYVQDLQKRGICCFYAPFLTSIDDYLWRNGKYLNLIMLFRAPHGGKYIDLVKEYAPQAKIVFNTVDLHFLREIRASDVSGILDPGNTRLIENDEIRIMRKADATIVVSEFEQRFLGALDDPISTHWITVPRRVAGRAQDHDTRSNILFIGSYPHQPNIDAVFYFVEKIWPLVSPRLPGCEFWIVGSGVPPEIDALADERVKVIGYVPDLSEVFDRCRLSVAPLRFGAGIKGKILTSLGYGVPCVATSIAAEGMGLTHGTDVLISDEPVEFAELTVELYENGEKWEHISDNGLALVQRKYSLEQFESKLAYLLHKLDLDRQKLNE